MEILLPVQKYLTVVLLFIAAFMWLLLRKDRGEEGLSPLKINRAYTILVLLLLPYLVGVFSNFSEDIALVGRSFLTTLVFLSLIVVLVKLNKKSSKERTNYLKELLKESKKHPIRYEFARKIVVPELKKLHEKEEEIAKKKRKLDAKNKADQTALKSREDKIKKDILRYEGLEKYVNENLKLSETKKKSSEEKEKTAEAKLADIKRLQHSTDKKEDELIKKAEELKQKIKEYNDKEKELEDERENYKKEINKKSNETISRIKFEATQKIRHREAKFNILEEGVIAMRKDVLRREKNISPRVRRIERREKEVESRMSRIRMKESEIREALDNLQILKKKMSKEEKELNDAKEDFEDFRIDTESKQRKIDRIKEIYDKKNEALKRRESELDNLSSELNKRKRNLDEHEKRIAIKNKEAVLMKNKLKKEIEEAVLDKNKEKSDSDLGDIISEKPYKSKKANGGRR